MATQRSCFCVGQPYHWVQDSVVPDDHGDHHHESPITIGTFLDFILACSKMRRPARTSCSPHARVGRPLLVPAAPQRPHVNRKSPRKFSAPCPLAAQ